MPEQTEEVEIPFEEEDASDYTGPISIEVTEPVDPLGGKKAEDLLVEIKAKEEQMLALKAQADQTAALTGAFGAFGDKLEKTLKQQQAPVSPMPTREPGESIEAFRERVKSDFLLDPVKASTEIIEKFYRPAMDALARATMAQSKELVMLHPEKRAVYDKYSQEVESLATRPDMLGNPRAYQEAIERVQASHVEELLEDRVAKLVEQRVSEALAKQGVGTAPTQAAPAPRGAYVENAPAKSVAPGGTSRGVVRMTAKQKAEYDAYLSLNMDRAQAMQLALSED